MKILMKILNHAYSTTLEGGAAHFKDINLTSK